MKKASKTIFSCQSCGYQAPKWMGMCADCGGWGSFVEERQAAAGPLAIKRDGAIAPATPVPSDVKKVIDDLRRDQALWTGTYVDNHVKEALAWSKEKHKHQLCTLAPADVAEILKLLKPMQDAYVKKVTAAGLPGEQILKDATALKEKYEKQYKK